MLVNCKLVDVGDNAIKNVVRSQTILFVGTAENTACVNVGKVTDVRGWWREWVVRNGK